MRLVCFMILFYYGHCLGFEPSVSTNANPFVITSSGCLVGKYMNVLGTEVAAFLGIPYAHPPVNELRFLKPYPLEHWGGILEATVKSPPCMQYSSRNFSWIPETAPSEDCLYLNIWIPANCCRRPWDRLPVLVWIHGGGFYSGSSDMDIYDGSTVASQNQVVVVSMNYRVGIFGFLNAGSKDAPGNVGLLDQNMAMKWIKTNIEHFGGDPNRITIMGESAGAWSVSLHMVSPMSRGLFNSAILQSGTAFHPLLVDNADISYYKANTYAKAIGCLTDNSSSIQSDPEIMECIKSKTSWELAKVEDMFTSKLPQFFLPTYGNEFLPTSPIIAISQGNIAPVDVLIGNNRDEATLFLNYMIPDVFKQNSEPLLNLEAAQQVISGLFNIIPQPTSSEIYQQYFQNMSDGANSSEIVKALADSFGDYVFNCPTYFFAKLVKNAYVYWFTHRSETEKKAEWLGVPHFYEVPYVFGLPLHDKSSDAYTIEDAIFSADLMKKWTTFARMGHPLGDKNPQDWPLFTEENLVFELNPGRESSLIYPRADICEFWRPYIVPEH